MPRPEGRHVVGPVADKRHPHGLQNLTRSRQIEDQFRTGTDNRHRRVRQLEQIGRDIHAGLTAAMHPANAARGENVDTGAFGKDHRCRHRCRAKRRRARHAGERNGKIAPRQLCHTACRGQPPHLVSGKSGMRQPVKNRHRRRHRAGGADTSLGRLCHLDILRMRQAMADQGRFKRHQRAALTARGGNLCRHPEFKIGIHCHSHTSTVAPAA